MATEDQIIAALKSVIDPNLRRDVVSLGAVGKVRSCDGIVSVDLSSAVPGAAEAASLSQAVQQAIYALPGVSSVTVNVRTEIRKTTPASAVMTGVKNVIAVASGKGGVGKSTVAANLACALQRTGASVGLMDCDIYGPSQPMMFGIASRPVVNQRGNLIEPIEQYGVALMSMGFLSNDKTPVIWRGPMVHQLLRQFLTQVDWGERDFVVMDLPPGTGDAQLTLTQLAPLSGAVIVTTPQDVSVLDARKGLRMFQEVKVPVLGVVENMSVFTDPATGRSFEIFRRGGARRLCEEHGSPFLGEIPIDPEVAVGGDEGTPIVLRNPDSPAARAFRELADKLVVALAGLSYQTTELPSLKLSV